MITPHVKGSKWEITYKISGYKKVFSERFDTIEEAKLRVAEIEFEKKSGTLRPPSQNRIQKNITLSDLLDMYIEAYGTEHWSESYYSSAVRRIDNYIKPMIGYMLLRDLDAPFIESYYKKLQSTTAVKRIGVHEELITPEVIERIHVILRGALNQAVRWGYMDYNPVNAIKPPKHPKKVREVWTVEEAQLAVEQCDEPILKISMMLSIGCSLRLGEILGLQWDSVHITDDTLKTGTSYLEVKQELKRCNLEIISKLALEKRGDIYFTFPLINKFAKSVLVLKHPKTDSSFRKVYIPNVVAKALFDYKAVQDQNKSRDDYEDYNMVICFENGRPVEQRIIGDYMRKLFKKTGLRPVVFHSLRHLSTSLKLQLSNGDIKAVQGDTGHSQSKMVLDVYAHTFDSDRQKLAGKVNQTFFNDVLNKDALDQETKKQQLISLLDSSPEFVDAILNLAKNYIS